jgi:hypothetical protein
MRRLCLLPMILAIAGIACETREAAPGDSSSGAQHVRVERKEEPEPPAACGTLRDVVPGDLVVVDGDLVLHLDETEGLGITNVADPAHPRTIGRMPFVGTPVALHHRAPLVWMAYVDWNVPGAMTTVRVVDVSRPETPRIVGTASRPGVATATALVGGVLYLMTPSGVETSVSAFRASNGVTLADAMTIDGAPAALAASPAGLAALTKTSDGVLVSWIDLSYERPGAMTLRGAKRIDGGFPAWERDVVSADEGQAVRFLACKTSECRVDEDALVRVVDFSRGADDVRASLPVRVGAGVPVARFADDHLYVADNAGHATLRVVDLHPSPRVVGSVPLTGMVSAIHPQGSRVLAVGTVGTPGTGIRVAVHDVDVRMPSLPRLRGTATFGHDWTWSRAADDDRAVSVDPTTELMALPFSTWRARDGRYATGAQVLALGGAAPAMRETLPADGHVERVVIVKGRVLAIGEGAVKVLEPASERELEVR